MPGWTAVCTPVGIPQPVFRRLEGDVLKALKLAEAVEKINQTGFEVIGNWTSHEGRAA